MWIDHKKLFEVIPQRTLFRMMTERRIKHRVNGKYSNGKSIREVDVLSLPLEHQAKALKLLRDDPPQADGLGGLDLTSVPDHHLGRALDRIAACRQVVDAPRGQKTAAAEAAAERVGISIKQLYRDLSRYRKAVKGGENLLAVMLPKWKGPGRGRALPDDLIAWVKAEYLKPTRPSAAKVHRALDGECKKRGIPTPSYPTVRRLVAEIPGAARVRHRKGKEAYRKTVMPKVARDYEPLRVNELWCGDHHQLDLMVRHKGKIMRPWVTVWQDLKTRAVVGFQLSPQPNSWTIALALRHAILPKPEGQAYPMMGVPERLYIDNGRDFRSHHLGGAAKRFKVDFNRETRSVIEALHIQQVTHAKPYTPWAKTVERLFRTLEEDCVRELPGWCGNKPSERPEKLKRELAGGRLLSFDEAREAVNQWIVHEYHARSHAGQGMEGRSPLEAWLGTDRVVREFDEKALDLLLMKDHRRKVRADGISLNGYRYWADELAAHVGDGVTVSWSPDEIGRILVFHRRQFICEAFCEPLYSFNASEGDLKKIQRRQRDAERATMKVREELVARAAESDPVARHFEREELSKAAAERRAGKEKRVRILSEMEAAAREIAKPSEKTRRLAVWDDEIEEAEAQSA
jgi:putative transposase